MEDECYPGAFQKEIVINNLYEKLLEEETKGWPIAQNRTLGLRLITKES